ncbi:YCF20-like protein [Perilla frutescens var. frutescens]|nr:YCF20-like protein [Perilla frutescens var. frutescens]
MVLYSSTLKLLLLLPRDSKSRLLTALSYPNTIPIHLTFSHVHRPFTATRFKRLVWSLRSATADDDNRTGETRLIRTIQAFRIKLIARLKELTKNLPVKLFSFLVGFYCATAFATVIGQTGDWDVLSAALAVAVVEGIGALMYKASFPLLHNFKNSIIISNYWKAGLQLGLFLDSFKY